MTDVLQGLDDKTVKAVKEAVAKLEVSVLKESKNKSEAIVRKATAADIIAVKKDDDGAGGSFLLVDGQREEFAL